MSAGKRDRLESKRRHRTRKRLLRQQDRLASDLRHLEEKLGLDGGRNGAFDRVREQLVLTKKTAAHLAARMIRYGLSDRCELLDHLAAEVMDS